MSNKNKIEAIRPYLEGKKVLDIGCVDHSSDVERTERWMHKELVKISSSCIGIDILEEDVRTLRNKGYDIRCANAIDFSLSEDFDVVFAGEIIEHLSNFEDFLQSVKAHLRPAGVLIITTPNVFSIWYFIITFLGIRSSNPEHVCWFDYWTINTLLEREGFELIDTNFIRVITRDDLWALIKCLDLKRLIWRFVAYLAEAIPPARVGCRSLVIIARTNLISK